MAWEKRHGRMYYYRKVRCGDRILSLYIGNEAIAGPVVQKAMERRQEEQERRAAFLRHKTDMCVAFAAVGTAVKHIDLMASAALLCDGYYLNPNSEWRVKQRGNKNTY